MLHTNIPPKQREIPNIINLIRNVRSSLNYDKGETHLDVYI